MKLAIKVLTEWDRLNVIPFFEKHYPNCNKIMDWHLVDIGIGDLMWVDEVNDLRNNDEDIPFNYTILQGVPKDMELPKLEPTKSREQELEEFVKFTFNIVDKLQFPTESELKEISNKAKQLLNK